MIRVFLVPGFFGFTNLGSLNYFQGVAQLLRARLAERGVEAEVLELPTQPTSSIRRRAVRLLDAVRALGGLESDALHFVGHSTGGLDLRLLLTPGVRLEASDVERELGRRTRSVVTVATPHFGTPIANFFTSFNGRNLLLLLTLLATSRPGRLGVWAAAKGLTHLARLDDLLGQRNTILDSFSRRLLADVSWGREDELYAFLREIASDQGAMLQLTPESIDLFNASVTDRPGVEYVSILTAAPPPRLRLPGKDLYALASRVVFSLAWLMASREHRHYPYPHPGEAATALVREALPFAFGPGTNDGIVPTMSQVWGHLGGVWIADHLDVVGQFPHDLEGEPYPGWLSSGSGFGAEAFSDLWGRIADVVAGRPVTVDARPRGDLRAS